MKKKEKKSLAVPSSVSSDWFQSTQVAPVVKEAEGHCQVVVQSVSVGEFTVYKTGLH